MSAAPALGGVRDLEDLRQRSRIDDETGCWIVQGVVYKGSLRLWLAELQCTRTLTWAMAWLLTGKPAPKGKLYVAMCGNVACGNPAHRKLGDRALLMRVMRPQLDPAHRSKIQRAQLARSRHYSPERRAEIMASDTAPTVLARQLGMDASSITRIRRGEMWNTAAPGSSVFNLGRHA